MSAESAVALVVDDDAAIAQLLAMMLRHLGYEVEVLSDYAHALDRLESEGDDFEALITDLHLEKGDGRAILRACRSHHEEARMICVSGSLISPKDLASPDFAGVAILHKPFTLQDLSKALASS